IPIECAPVCGRRGGRVPGARLGIAERDVRRRVRVAQLGGAPQTGLVAARDPVRGLQRIDGCRHVRPPEPVVHVRRQQRPRQPHPETAAPHTRAPRAPPPAPPRKGEGGEGGGPRPPDPQDPPNPRRPRPPVDVPRPPPRAPPPPPAPPRHARLRPPPPRQH